MLYGLFNVTTILFPKLNQSKDVCNRRVHCEGAQDFSVTLSYLVWCLFKICSCFRAAGQVLEQGANQVTILIVMVMTHDQL